MRFGLAQPAPGASLPRAITPPSASPPIITKDAIDAGNKKAGSTEPWSKIKFDRQIVATAKVVGASAIYTDDGGLRYTATAHGFQVIGLADIPIPPEAAQTELQFDASSEPDEAAGLSEIDELEAAENPSMTD